MVMYDVVLSRAKRGYKVSVYRDDRIVWGKGGFEPTYAKAKKRALSLGRPVLDVVRGSSYKPRRR